MMRTAACHERKEKQKGRYLERFFSMYSARR